MSRVAEFLNVDYSTACYHVRVLARHGAVNVLHLGGLVRVYPAGAAPAREERAAIEALASATARGIAREVMARGEATLRDVMLALDLPRSTVQEHLRRLADAGVVDARPARSGPTVYGRGRWPSGVDAPSAVLAADPTGGGPGEAS